MKKGVIFILSLFITIACDKKTEQASLLSPGISLDLANFRKKQVSNVVYNLTFQIPEHKKEAIKSFLELNLEIKNLEHPLYLDFNEVSSQIKNVEVNKKYIPVKHQEEHLIIDIKYLKLGTNSIEIKFNAGDLSLNRNEDYLYTLLVPDRASTLFPCFDQPNIKAHYNLEISAPKDWEVLSGANLDFKETIGDFINYKFKESDKMSTYLFSFVAGDFKKVNKQLGDLDMNMLYRENDEEKVKFSINEIFKLHQESVLFLEDYTQYKFPFQKLDYVSIPGFQYGGMEHIGAIQYRESSLFLDDDATRNQKLNRCHLIAHETAHMWFGDLVTMNWFDDVWLKEVFANFLADKISKPAFPHVNHNLNFMSEHYASAYAEDRTKGATAIKQPLNNLKNAGTLYGNIIYHKAPIMMRQLEALVGEVPFKRAMRNYVSKFANDNADWNDLVTLLDNESDVDIRKWSNIWVHQPGRPIIFDNISYNNDKIVNFEIEQKAEDGSNNIWAQTFKMGLIYKDSVKVVSLNLNKRKQVLNNLIGLQKPEAIIYNYDAFGYGVFPIDSSFISKIPLIRDDVARAYSYINLYENVLSTNIQPEKALDVLIHGISTEKEELVLNRIIGNTSSIFWNYITEDHRIKTEITLEKILYQRLLDKDLSVSIKKTLFNLFESMAYSQTGKDILYRIWSKSLVIKNLNLNENDYTGIASALALYNHPETEHILKVALEDISNPDRKIRFEYLLPSLSNKQEERDAFMLSLAKPENREKESWVSVALNNIHHPLRQHSAQKHLKMCLELVEEIQVTGDIFFPKAWLNATIGAYTNNYAYIVLEQFLEENPNFPLVLKNKLMQAADGLYRAKQIRDYWR